MLYECKKKYGNLVSVREYIIDKCISKGEPLVIQHGEKQMTVGLTQLKRKWAIHSREFKSKYNLNQTYKLFDFVFKVDKVNKQLSLFD